MIIFKHFRRYVVGSPNESTFPGPVFWDTEPILFDLDFLFLDRRFLSLRLELVEIRSGILHPSNSLLVLLSLLFFDLSRCFLVNCLFKQVFLVFLKCSLVELIARTIGTCIDKVTLIISEGLSAAPGIVFHLHLEGRIPVLVEVLGVSEVDNLDVFVFA